MNDTLPPNLSAWSGPAAPQCCLANKSPARQSSERLQSALETELKARLNGRGSMIYRIVWKPHVTPLGRSISRQRASTPRTSDSAPTLGQLMRSGWPTPQARDHFPAHSEEYIAAKKAQGHGMANLNDVTQVSGWPTARAADGEKNVRTANGALAEISRKGSPQGMAQAAAISGWVTASARDWKDSAGMATTAINPDGSTRERLDQLPRQAQLVGPMRLTASGQILTGCYAGMESGGQLNPEHSRWLIGFPAVWGYCGAMAMQSIRNKPRPSSKRSKPPAQKLDAFG